MIDVSVVIPAKNRARTLPYCLDSVLSQSCPAKEVLVVDDGSTDQTADVVASYAAKGVRHVALQVGAGAQAARNAGVRAARFPWIAFQDSDDRWLPRKLELQMRALEEQGNTEDLVVHANGRRVDEVTGLVDSLVVSTFEGYCYRRLLTESGPMFPTMLVHRSALERIGLLDPECPSFQEWDTSIMLARSCRFVHVQEELFEWVTHSADTISKDRGRDLRGHEYVLKKHCEEIRTVCGESAWRVAVGDLAWKAARFGDYATASRLVREHLPIGGAWLGRSLLGLRRTPRGGDRLMRAACRLPF